MYQQDTHHSSHLKLLEAQSVYVMREVADELEQPALLFSGGKDSAVIAHLARRAFWPAPIPFPALHVDTGHNFPEVIEFRDKFLANLCMRAEREQGITIDVAYRHFVTSCRKFIIADAPGHGQYTRNMVCGASVSDLALLLVDARAGPTPLAYRRTVAGGMVNASTK